MRRRSLFVFLFPPILALALLALLAATWFAWEAVKRVEVERLASVFEERLRSAEPEIETLLTRSPAADRRGGCLDLAARLGVRISVFTAQGALHCDSADAALSAAAAPGGPSPEVLRALAGSTASEMRRSGAPGRPLMFVAVPVETPLGFIGVVRSAQPLPRLRAERSRLLGQTVLVAMVLALLSAVLALWLSRRLGRPISALESAARRFARGELGGAVAAQGPEEYGRLAEALKEMAGRLGERLRSVARQRSDLEIVFSSMVEAVLAIDDQERLIDLNPSAARLFGLSLPEARGRYLVETVRNADTIRFASSVLEGSGPMEGEIVLHHGQGDVQLSAQGNQLRDENDAVIGAIVVLHDVTRIRKLEAVRRDFVANVSHELKTPITSIKGFVETLQDGALEKKEEARKFLAIIERQAARLVAIIDDLLALSRIEQEDERSAIPLAPGEIVPVLREAIQACEGRAREKNLTLELECPEPLSAPINAPLLEQALVNLLDNALKHSPEGGVVRVRAVWAGGLVEISVRDEGPGIPARHLDRLFERFYRVDPARSREQGGTGLGLAIVKHIAQAHGGSAAVESTSGRGATFFIRLPL